MLRRSRYTLICFIIALFLYSSLGSKFVRSVPVLQIFVNESGFRANYVNCPTVLKHKQNKKDKEKNVNEQNVGKCCRIKYCTYINKIV